MDAVAETISRVCQTLAIRMDSQNEKEAESAREALGELMPSIEGILGTNSDGGPGSGNWGHAGRPGHKGGSAPGGGKANRLATPDGGFTSRAQAEKENRQRGKAAGSHQIVNGENILGTYDGDKETRSVIHAQGFDGKPRVVGQKEFDEAVAKSGFIAQRSYAAPDQDTLKEYERQLYEGEFYVDCTTGGAQYGHGMYCAADYEGNLTSGIEAEMNHYKDLGKRRFPDRVKAEKEAAAKKAQIDYIESHKDQYSKRELNAVKSLYLDKNDPKHDTCGMIYAAMTIKEQDKVREIWANAREKAGDKIRAMSKEQLEDYLGRKIPGPKTKTETLTLDPSAKIITHEELLHKMQTGLTKGQKDEIFDNARIGRIREISSEYGENAELVAKALMYETQLSEHDIQLGGTYEDRQKAIEKLGRDKYDQIAKDNKYSIITYSSQKLKDTLNEAEKYRAYKLGYDDAGAYAAALGYDAINAEHHGKSGSYTVVLNRSKMILLDTRGQYDAKETDSGIHFQYGEDGILWAIRDGEVIGQIYSYDPTMQQDEEAAEMDGGPGSGNWGHAGRPGHRGGSAAGGGKAFRLSTPSGGYTSRSQAEKENKLRGNASGSSSVVNGKDITDTYDGDKDTRSIIHAQGFDGKPRVVSKDEFDKAVAESSFIAQRTYSAPNQETLDKYRDQLYDGEFYVECTEGGAQYGQGMYCAADYTGKLSDGVKAEMKYYKEQYRYLGEDKTKEEWISDAKQALQAGGIKSKYASEWAEGYFDKNNEYLISLRQKWKITEEDRDAMNDVLHNVPRQKEQPSYTETLTLDPSAKVVSYDDIYGKYKGILKKEVEKEIENRAKKEYESKVAADYGVDADAVDKMLFPASEKEYRDAVATLGSKKAHDMYFECNRYAYQKIEEAATRASKESGRNKGYKDVGAYAAALGYDAINADGHGESGSYTVILNRTKAIFLDGRGQRDAKDAESGIVFQYGDDGVLWAIKDREVIGRIYAYDPTEREYAETTELDGGPGSGNWGHTGRPGHRGGSASGGGKANRIGTAETGYSSAAKERAKAKENGGGNDPCSSIASPDRLAAIKRYLPTEGSQMWNEHQGWNKMRAEYLKELGHDEKDIAQLDAVASQHVAYAHTGDNSMKELAGRNPDILNDAAAYEVEAAKLRRQIKQQEADKYVEHQRTQKERLMAEIGAVEKGDMEDLMGYGRHKEEFIESADSKIKNAESRREQLNGPITLYRKGDYNHPVLSFSENKGGTTLYKGTDYEVTLHPDHTNTLDELVGQGILPISGFGSVSNFYGESEVTFVNTRELTANGDTAMDGGPGSGNWGHAGRPGHKGGSAPGGGKSFRLSTPDGGYTSRSQAEKENSQRSKGMAHKAVDGKNIAETYDGDTSTRSVIHAQGFDGPPKVVGQEEFDKAVSESGFIAQRTYCAPTQDIIREYERQLYEGEFYIECTVGGAQYGKGMYCAADYSGKLSDGIEAEMSHYERLGKERNEPLRYAREKEAKKAEASYIEKNKDGLTERELLYVKYVTGNATSAEEQEYLNHPLHQRQISDKAYELADEVGKAGNKIRIMTRNQFTNYSGKTDFGEAKSKVETLTFDKSAKVITYDELRVRYSGIIDDDMAIKIKNNAKIARAKEIAADYGSDSEMVEKLLLYNTDVKKNSLTKENPNGGTYADEEKAISKLGLDKCREIVFGNMDDIQEYAAQELKKAEAKVAQESHGAKKYDDMGAYAAALGYDAINAEGHGASSSYTVVLNRTKMILLDTRGQYDAKDSESEIFFQYAEDGTLWAIRDGEVVGQIYSYDPTTQPQIHSDADDTKECAAVLVIRDGHVLCADRKDGKGVCGPGGHIQEGETPEQAAVREAQEEFNITPLNIIPYGKLDGSTGLYRNTTLYFTDHYEGEPQTDGEEMSGARWMSLGELRKERLFRAFWDGIQIFLDAIKNSENPLTNTQLRVTINTNKTPNTDGGPGSGFLGHRGRPGHKGGALPRLAAGVIAKALEDGVISKKLDRKSQLKHYEGTTDYNEAVAEGYKVSFFSIGMDELETIISENAGKGKGYGNGRQYKEVINAGKTVGTYLTRDGEKLQTTNITIHYAKKGCHAVPAFP